MGKQKNRNNKKKLKQASLTFRSGRQPTWPGPLGSCRLPHGGQSRQLGGEPWARRRRGLLLGFSPRTPERHDASTTPPAPLPRSGPLPLFPLAISVRPKLAVGHLS